MNDSQRFDPDAVGSFRVVDWRFDPGSRTVSLHYALGDAHHFVETVTFESDPGPAHAGAPDAPGFERALSHLHIAAGVSYYKAAAPAKVIIEGTRLSPDEREFHRHLYDDGLREFAVANLLAVPRPVVVEADAPESTGAVRGWDRPGGVLVPIGGGKDSMVLIEALRDRRPTLFAVNPHPLVVDLAERTGLRLLVVRRRLAPELAVLNGRGARNGHVPITAIISLIAVAGSFLYGYDTIAMAVERSASEETTLVDGVRVNHQYSKSLDFERLLQGLVTTSIDPGLVYGSALRPYSELAIARAFARLTEYHATFCSCNTVFRQGAEATARWCGDCPKCRFVGLVLAPFIAPDALSAIIGRDMFDDPGQVAGFAALMSDTDKPFECVGERRESAAAMRLLSELPAWREKPVVAALSGPARSLATADDLVHLLTPAAALGFPEPDIGDRVDRFMRVAS